MGGPISTANGNYHYSQSTPAIPTVGDPLRLTWSYNSLRSGVFPEVDLITTSLGLGSLLSLPKGWTHNYDIRLDGFDIGEAEEGGDGGDGGPFQPGGSGVGSLPDGGFRAESNVVTFKAFHGTPLKFEYVKEQFRPAPGVRGSLARTEIITNQYVYTLTAANQATYIFDTDGRLVEQFDPQGNALTFTYNISGNLTRVSEPVSGRYLDFAYDAEGRLSSVSDPINRSTQFGYDAQGLLRVVTDTRGLAWQYDYTPISTPLYDKLVAAYQFLEKWREGQ